MKISIDTFNQQLLLMIDGITVSIWTKHRPLMLSQHNTRIGGKLLYHMGNNIDFWKIPMLNGKYIYGMKDAQTNHIIFHKFMLIKEPTLESGKAQVNLYDAFEKYNAICLANIVATKRNIEINYPSIDGYNSYDLVLHTHKQLYSEDHLVSDDELRQYNNNYLAIG